MYEGGKSNREQNSHKSVTVKIKSTHLLRRNEIHILLTRCAENLNDALQLVDVVLAREDGLPPEELGEDAAAAPEVHRHRVVILRQHDLRRAVPARHDVLGEVLRRAVVDAAGESEVTHLEVAVRVEEQVGGLQVAVQHLGAVDVLHSAKHLVDEVLYVVVREVLAGVNDPMEIRLHEVGDDVDVLKGLERARLENVNNTHHILVLQVLQQLDLAQDALRVNDVIKRTRDLLDRHLLPRLCVAARNDDAVRAVADRFDELVLRVDLRRAREPTAGGARGVARDREKAA